MAPKAGIKTIMTTPLDYRPPEAHRSCGVHWTATLLAGVGAAAVGFGSMFFSPAAVFLAAPIAGGLAGGLAAAWSLGREIVASLICGSIPVVLAITLMTGLAFYNGAPPLGPSMWFVVPLMFGALWLMFVVPAVLAAFLVRPNTR